MKSEEKIRAINNRNKPEIFQDIQTVNREQTATRFAMYRDAIAGIGRTRHGG